MAIDVNQLIGIPYNENIIMSLNILKNSSNRVRERKKFPIKQRLLNNIEINKKTGCWEWQGSKSKYGHGRIGFRDKVYLVHRISYEIFKGKIPENLFVCHKCDNPPCINPEHLFLGTQNDNMRDAWNKGRTFKIPSLPGEKNPMAKLSNEKAKEIKIKLKNGAKGIVIAKEYNISATQVSRLKLNKVYKNL